MSDSATWLPELVSLNSCDGNWESYLDTLYRYFREDFIEHLTRYRGIEIKLKQHPFVQGKEATFWHLISEGKVEDERMPDLRRCERIRWPRPIIEHVPDARLKVWPNKRGNDNRLCIWFENAEYLVVLNERKGYLILWTAYPVIKNHRKKKLQKEYNKNTKAAQ